MFLVWYTYSQDVPTLHYWYTGQANYVPGSNALPVVLYATQWSGWPWEDSGAIGKSRQVGAATLTFHSCKAASLTYGFTSGAHVGWSGTIALSRIEPAPSHCAP